MIHPKDRHAQMLCSGCSPFDIATAAAYVSSQTLCPACSNRIDERSRGSKLRKTSRSSGSIFAAVIGI